MRSASSATGCSFVARDIASTSCITYNFQAKWEFNPLERMSLIGVQNMTFHIHNVMRNLNEGETVCSNQVSCLLDAFYLMQGKSWYDYLKMISTLLWHVTKCGFPTIWKKAVLGHFSECIEYRIHVPFLVVHLNNNFC